MNRWRREWERWEGGREWEKYGGGGSEEWERINLR